jgi:hypothetical protein
MRALRRGVLHHARSKNNTFVWARYYSLQVLCAFTLSQGFLLLGVVSPHGYRDEASSTEVPRATSLQDRGFTDATPPPHNKEEFFSFPSLHERRQPRRRLTSGCPPGSVNRVGTEKCAQCRAGWFNNDTETSDIVSSCTRCTPGHYNDEVGQSECKKCAIGNASNTSARYSMCDACDPGKYADALGLRECKLCPNGWVQPVAGQAECTECNRGYYIDAEGASTCMPCSVGWVQNYTGADKCEPCTPGKYQSDSSESVCNDCVIGKYASNKGQALCKACKKGRFANETGEGECKVCADGQYQVCDRVLFFEFCRDCPCCSSTPFFCGFFCL